MTKRSYLTWRSPGVRAPRRLKKKLRKWCAACRKENHPSRSFLSYMGQQHNNLISEQMMYGHYDE